MKRRLATLRWQLTLSHLAATAVTLVSMIAALALLSSAWIARMNSTSQEPAQDARVVARGIAGVIMRGEPSELSGVLRAVAAGEIRLQAGPGWLAPEAAARMDQFGPSLRNVAYVVVLGPDGRMLGSSAPEGAAFSPPERAEWEALAHGALSGQRDPRELVAVRMGAGPAAIGAAPVTGPEGSVAVVLVATRTLPPPDRFSTAIRALLVFGAATIGVLGGSFVFALASASLVAYGLARRLVGRLERLGAASEALAAGDLDRRVDEGPSDEVGRLARRFNHMADRLSETVSELDGQRREAEAALRARRELVANVSHELRTPLASIRAHTESLLMLGAGAQPERQTEALDVVYRESEHLSRLIDDLFVLSTAEAGALALAPRAVEVGDVVDEVARSFQPFARRGKISLLTDVPGDVPAVMADRERVVQLLGNLVRNALRFTLEGGLVSMRAERAGSLVRVSVEDTGIGVSSDRLPRLFDRFYRGDDARDRASGGAGLGLAIVRELVEAMGGDVGAESRPGEGSRFWFSLPIADGAATRGAATGDAVQSRQ